MNPNPTIKIGIIKKEKNIDLKHNYNAQRTMTVFDCCTAAMLCFLYYSGFARYKMPHSRQ